VHYQFETIHPFLDGNGRIGRLLITLMLCAEKRLAAPMLYLSAYFERRRQQYNDLMLNVSRDGQWEPWILFFLRGIALQARDAVQRTKQLQNLREQYRAKLTEARATAAALRLVDELFKLPVMSYGIAERVLGFSWQSSRDTVLKLAELGIVHRLKDSGKQHLYLCDDIIRIVDAVEAVPPPAELKEVQLPLLSESADVTQQTSAAASEQ
jgi:Fic family protein